MNTVVYICSFIFKLHLCLHWIILSCESSVCSMF